MRDICEQETLRQKNEDGYNQIRLQMHNKLIKKLHSLKEEWKLDNVSQVYRKNYSFFFEDLGIFRTHFLLDNTYITHIFLQN